MRRLLTDLEVEDVRLSVVGVGEVTVRVLRDKHTGRTTARILEPPPTLRLIRGGRA
jgi:hypothetical protein